MDLVYLLGRDGNTIPYLQLRTGYSWSRFQGGDGFGESGNGSGTEATPDRHRGGFMINPAVSLRMQDLFISAGFNIDNASWDQNGFADLIIRDSVSFRRITVGIGFHF